MLGFFKRDLSLQLGNAKFYLCFVLAFTILSFFSDFSASFASLYLVIFSGTSIMSLFSYDDANHWEAYAAAVPGGRGAMVDARYLMALGLAAVVFLFQLLLGVITKTGLLDEALLWAGILLLYAAVLLPIAYRFGGTKSRVVMIVVVGVLSGGVALLTTALKLSDSQPLPALALFPGLLPLVGLAVLVVSHRISRHIMARKEL